MPSLTTLQILGVFAVLATAQSDVADCGLNCISNVTASACGQAQWSCLCKSQAYLTGLDSCAKEACNQADYDTTISAVAEICGVFNDTVTVTPYATASTGTGDPLLSTVGANISISSLPTSSAIDTMQTVASTTYSISRETMSPTTATASSPSTTNVAGTFDLRTSALHGIALFLLGIALYL